MNSQSGSTLIDELDHYALFRGAAKVLASSRNLEQALSNTISVCLPYLADFGFFDVILDDGVRRTARAHQDPILEARLQASQWERNQRTDINLCALSSGEPVLHENTDDAWYSAAFDVPRALPFRSMLSVPLRMGSELLGSLTLFMNASGRNHNNSHFTLAMEIAALATPIVMNARLLHRERLIQSALKQSEERLRSATSAGKIGIWEWVIPTNQVTWSERVYELHGLKPGEFGGTVESFAELIFPEDRASALQHITEALPNANTLTDEFRVVWPDGSIHWLTTSSYIERDSAGQAVRMLGSTADITEQKNLQSSLQELNSQLSKQAEVSTSERDRIWGISQDILAVASFSGYLITVNPAFTKILGWGEQEVLTFPFIELCHPDQVELVNRTLEDLAITKHLEHFEVQTLHKNGQYRWLSWTVVVENDLLYAVGRDVTEIREHREHINVTTERRFQLALTAGGMGAWQWDLKDGSVYWWPGMDKIHGLPVGSCITSATDYLRFVHPDDISRLNISLDEMLLPKTFKDVEYRIIWPDGTVHWIESRREQILDRDGTPIQVAGVCIDITERKLTEQNLRFLADASAEFAEVVDHQKTLAKIAQLAVPTFADWCTVDLIDEAGALERVAVCHVDPAKVRLAHELHEKYPPDPSAPRGPWNIVRTGQAEFTNIDDDLLKQSIKDPMHLDIVRQLGLRSYIGVPLLVRGKTLGVLTFISAESRRTYTPRDVALAEDIGKRAAIAIENSRFYRALKEADRRKDDFLAMLAHELRNPLAPIRAAADLLKFPLSPERINKTSDIISRQVNHMTGLVDDLLDVSRVTRGLIVIEKLPVAINAVITMALEQTRPQIDAKNHNLDVQLPGESVFVEGDEERLVQVISNLLTNAIKFTPAHGHINLNVDVTEEAVEICVRDNGVGMPADLLANVFDLFVQGKRASDRGQGGLGLGLALVKSLVTLHGGTVVARSKGDGLGSEFVLNLPRLLNCVDPETHKELPQLPIIAKTLNILIVDDNKDAADTLAVFLQTLGHEVQVVYDPYDALDKIADINFDDVILDIGLPGIDGYELANQIRRKLGGSTPRLIALTGYGQQSDRNKAYIAGIDHYFVKPLSVQKLLELLDQ